LGIEIDSFNIAGCGKPVVYLFIDIESLYDAYRGV